MKRVGWLMGLVNGIHEALVASIGMPPDELSNLVGAHDAQSFFYSRTFNGFARSDQVVVVEITMRRGRSDAMKRGLYAAIARNLHEKAQVLSSGVFIFTHENDYSDWSVGGGTFASRGLTLGGEAALRAAKMMRDRLVNVAALLLECKPESLTLAGGAIRDALGSLTITLVELARVLHFRQYKIPRDIEAQPMVVAHYVPERPYYFANGVQASLLSIDIETGFIRLLKHWIVEDCGRIINPQLVDEQLRGGIVQGIGAVLLEELRYDERGQLTNASMMDYLVPMAFEMPDIVVAHIETPVPGTLFGGKGVGEAGTIGAGAAVANAVNDALSSFNCVLTDQPFTPERVLRALGKVR